MKVKLLLILSVLILVGCSSKPLCGTIVDKTTEQRGWGGTTYYVLAVQADNALQVETAYTDFAVYSTKEKGDRVVLSYAADYYDYQALLPNSEDVCLNK